MKNKPGSRKSQLREILRDNSITVLFQPVIHLGLQAIIGYQARIRGPASSDLSLHETLYEVALEHDRLIDLEYLYRERSIARFTELNLPGALFISVQPNTFSDRLFIPGKTLQLLQEHGLDPSRVIIEIADFDPIQNQELVQFGVRHYREMGVKLALRETGNGYSSLALWTELFPDYVKVAHASIAGVDTSSGRRRYVSALMEISRSVGNQLIIEGVSTAEEYATLRNMGINLVHGDYFAAPLENPDTVVDARKFSERVQRKKTGDKIPTIAKLIKPLTMVQSTDTMQAVERVFEQDENIPSLGVIDSDGYPLSLIIRSDFMNILASRYGRELFARKPISEFIKRKVLIIDHETRLEDVSRSITNSSDYYTEEFIITSQGKVMGKALLLDLLSAITDLQITRARYANPLTLLPGNVVIQQKMDELVNAREPFIVAYCDLDNFKAYNDVYGYLRGDELIRLTGRLLGEVSHEHFDFVGHIGGDDFIILFKSPDWRERCENLLSKMEHIIPNYYTDADKLRGGIVTVDRYGATRQFPFVSLSIGALAIDRNYEQVNMDSIAETATDAKKIAKKTSGNSFYLVENP